MQHEEPKGLPFLRDTRGPESSGDWARAIEAVGPASMLVAIEANLGASLRRKYTAEDVWQETLLHAWRDRARLDWRGPAPFRAWLLEIAWNRIRDLAAWEAAGKRGGQARTDFLSALKASRDTTGGSTEDFLAATTTPSRIALYREEAEAMKTALDGLEDDVRDVVRLRLFEELTMEEIAARLDIGVSAVRHRFRRGAASYEKRLSPLRQDLSERRARVGPRGAG